MSRSPLFLMSPPRSDWTLRGKANFRSQSANAVDARAARREWSALADAIVEAGGEVIVCPPNPRKNLTGMIYTAEAGEFYVRDGMARFLLPNMATEHRRDEADWIGGFMEGLGIRTRPVRARWEAQGDVLRTDHGQKLVHTFGSGTYRRTEAQAYQEVAHLLSDRHIQIHFRADPWFHGNTFLNFYHGATLPPRLGEEESRVPTVMLVCPDALMPGELDRLIRFVPHAEVMQISRAESEGYDTNCLQVNGTVIASDTLSDRAEYAFHSLELEIVKLDFDELFSKGGGAPVCMTNRLWGADVDLFPKRVRWSKYPSLTHHTDV